MKVWLKGLAASFITGASGMLASVVIDSEHFNPGHGKHLAMVAGISGLIGVAAYLKQSPLPPSQKACDAAATVNLHH